MAMHHFISLAAALALIAAVSAHGDKTKVTQTPAGAAAPSQATTPAVTPPAVTRTAAVPPETLGPGVNDDSIVIDKKQLEETQQLQASASPSTDKS